MTNSTIDKTLESAEAMCRDTGVRLTPKRKRALAVLLEAQSPISAYELIDLYNSRFNESLTAMSAYRMLNSVSYTHLTLPTILLV